MKTLQASLVGVPSVKLKDTASSSSLDAFQRLSVSVRSQPWPRLRRHSLGRKLIFLQEHLQRDGRNRALAGGEGFSSSGSSSGDETAPSSSGSSSRSSALESDDNMLNFCIIEGRDTVLDFAQLELQEIRDNISSRRNRIFLLMEEVRRLRIQQRIKSEESEQQAPAGSLMEDQLEQLEYNSSIPFLPPLTTATLQLYYATCLGLVAGIILFGGLLAPILELKLGLGGTSYAEFIESMHLPSQLSQVDPIVASFSGGAVGVISALMVVEVNNVSKQDHTRCRYCHGTGYLTCARCSGSGSSAVAAESDSPALISASPKTSRCCNCAGAGKVMCPTCLCTGVALATEHDPRIDPFV